MGRLVAAAWLLAGCGCSSINLQKYLPSLTGKTGEFRTPLQIVAFWSDTVRTAPGQPPMRGFGARLMFYEHRDGKPVKVAGSLAIYAFDEAHHDANNPKPDRKFVFPAEQFEKHYSKSELGHSYSVWVPWDPVGGETKQISLICRFSPVQGGAVVSEQVRQLLPGAEPDAPKSATEVAPLKVTHHQETADDFSRRHMDTTTIELNGPPDRRLPTAIARPRPAWPETSLSAAPAEQANGRSSDSTAREPIPAQGSTASAMAARQASSAPASQPVASGGALVTYGKAPPRNGSWLARFGRPSSDSPTRGPGPWRPTHVATPFNAQETTPLVAAAPSAGSTPPQ